jgi:hypothetical protein
MWQLTNPCSVKYFAHPDLDAFRREELVPRFAKVAVEKPKESRAGTSGSSDGHELCSRS